MAFACAMGRRNVPKATNDALPAQAAGGCPPRQRGRQSAGAAKERCGPVGGSLADSAHGAIGDALRGARAPQLSSQLAYLTKTADELARERSPVRTGADWRRTDVQRGALAHVTARLLQELAAALAAAVQGGQSAHDAWNAHLVEVRGSPSR